MLIPVGNMNDKGRINANPGAAKPGWLVFSFYFLFSFFFFLFHWEKEIKGKEGGKSIGNSFVKGISIQTAKYQEKSPPKDPWLGIMSVIACSQVQGLSVCRGAVAFPHIPPWGRLRTARALSVWYIPSSSSLPAIQPVGFEASSSPLLSVAFFFFARSNKSCSSERVRFVLGKSWWNLQSSWLGGPRPTSVPSLLSRAGLPGILQLLVFHTRFFSCHFCFLQNSLQLR